MPVDGVSVDEEYGSDIRLSSLRKASRERCQFRTKVSQTRITGIIILGDDNQEGPDCKYTPNSSICWLSVEARGIRTSAVVVLSACQRQSQIQS